MDKQPEALQIADDLEYSAHYSLVHTAVDELRRLHQYEIAYEIWSDKTHWVQETCESHELGMHRADVLKQRIDRLQQVNQELVEVAEMAAGIGIHTLPDRMKCRCSQCDMVNLARAILAKHKEQNG